MSDIVFMDFQFEPDLKSLHLHPLAFLIYTHQFVFHQLNPLVHVLGWCANAGAGMNSWCNSIKGIACAVSWVW